MDKLEDVKEKESRYNLLTNANNLKMHQDLLVYTIFGIFWAANAILVVGFFQSNYESKAFCLIIISIFGLCLSIIWSFIEYSIIKYHEFYEDLVDQIEKDLNIPTKFQTGQDNVKFNEYIGIRYIKFTLKAIPIVFSIVWFFVLLMGIISYIVELILICW